MKILQTLLLSLSWVHLALANPGDQFMGVNTTGVLEVDLMFPRNETYARLPYMPVVFALRNPGPPWATDPSLKVELWSSKQNATLLFSGFWTAVSQNPKNVDPFYSYWLFEELNAEDHWVMTWSLGWRSCSEKKPVDGQPGLFEEDFSSVVGGSVEFTTQNATRQLDLVAALQDDSCPGGLTSRATFNVTHNVMTPFYNITGGVPCAVVANATATEVPCSSVVKIDKAAAKSINARLKGTCAEVPSCRRSGAAPLFAVGGAAFTVLFAVASGWLAYFALFPAL